MLRQLALPLAWAVSKKSARRWRGVRFLAYHSVAKSESISDLQRVTLAIPESAFVKQLDLIGKLGYTVVSMNDALRLLTQRSALDKQYVCLTFDDGRIDNLQSAWPIVRSFGYTAHFFVSSGLVGKNVEVVAGGKRLEDRFIDRDGLRSMMAEGATVGSHGRTHRNLTTLDEEDLHRELHTSRSELEDITGAPVKTLAYPWSRYDARVKQATQLAGYDFGFGVNSATSVEATESERFEMPRNVVRSGDPLENYFMIQGGYDFAAAYTLWKRRAAG